MHTSIKAAIRRRIGSAARAMPIGVWRGLYPRDAICPFYHVVSDVQLPHVRYYPYKNRRQFEADVAYAREHFREIRYDDLRRRRSGARLPRSNSFLFTFDDGFEQCYSEVRPVLLEHGFGGLFFVTTDFLDSRTMFYESKLSLCISVAEAMGEERVADLAQSFQVEAALGRPERADQVRLAEYHLKTSRIAAPSSRGRRALILFLFSLQAEHEDEIEGWCARLGVDWKAYLRERRPYLTTDQVRQLASDGFVFGAHGVAHARLQNMDASSLEREVVQSCDTIRSVTGQKSVPFAFPWHGTGLDRRLLLDVLARHDFVDLYFDAGGFRPNVPQIVDRFWADIPGESNAATSNLPDLLREQWLRPEARAGADNSVP